MLSPDHIDALILDHPDARPRPGYGPAGSVPALQLRLGDRGIEVLPFPNPSPSLHQTPRDRLLGALHWLEVEPTRAAILTPQAEVAEAAWECGFALVCGLAPREDEGSLRRAGVHLVARQVGHIDLVQIEPPSPFAHVEAIRYTMSEFEPVVMLDYDGTLTPIVEDPSRALLSDAVRETVRKVSETYPTAVISGRDLRDVEELVGIEGIWFAGSHGAEARGPNLEHWRHPHGEALQELDAAARELAERLDPITGAQLERKHGALAVHFRRVPPDQVEGLEQIVADVLEGFETLRLGYGKMVLEVQPRTARDKGQAVDDLASEICPDPTQVVPLYIGDDITDENAFLAVKPNGIGILVSETARPTFADYRVTDPEEVHTFLRALLGD